MPKKTVDIDLRHESFKRELTNLLEAHLGQLPASHMLAVSAQITGMLICMQDQTKMTSDQAMETVMTNLVIGNEAAQEQVKAADERNPQ